MTKWVAAIAILLIIVGSFAFEARGADAQQAITVTEQGVENQFPDGLRFHLEAESSSPIEEIRVYVRKLGQSSRSVYRTVEFEPGERISGEALFRARRPTSSSPPERGCRTILTSAPPMANGWKRNRRFWCT